MSFQQSNFFTHADTLSVSTHSSISASNDFQHSSLNFHDTYFPYTNTSFDFHHSPLLPPNYLECNSPLNDSRISPRRPPIRQPIRHPHQHLVSRTENNCPTHLTGKQRTHWITAGQEAQRNHHLLSILNPFSWSPAHYDPIIHVHYRSSVSYLQGIIHKLSHVHFYTIDTELDKPTIDFPHSRPALLQIQAVHHESFSTVLLIEIQFLPETHSELFQTIQTLCQTIFSPSNTIMAWGDVQQELRPLLPYHLFDPTQIIHVINLQGEFTRFWNRSHPHSPDCLDQHQHSNEEAADDILICLVNTDDLEDDVDTRNVYDDYASCICPSDIRPYKDKNSIWKLQKAIHYVFNQALDKSLTLNIWSCGLDLKLRTWQSNSDRTTREALITYAINDVFAPTNLFFHVQSSPTPIQLHTVPPVFNLNSPFILILSDSQGKSFPPFFSSTDCSIVTKSISGLQWFNPYDSALSTQSVLASPSISSLLSTCNGVVFLIGTNSVRQFPAFTLLSQVEVVLDHLHSQHPHLNTKTNIYIIPAFPCLKVSSSFGTQESLSFNIAHYNHYLHQLSIRKNFSILPVPILPNQLSPDGMHIHVNYIPHFYATIQQHIKNLVRLPPPILQRTSRSIVAKSRRNKKRHQKLRERQRNQIVTRNISRVWELTQLKTYLQHRNILYAHLPEIYNHQLRLQFTHRSQQQYAERVLSFDEFNDDKYYNWISRRQ